MTALLLCAPAVAAGLFLLSLVGYYLLTDID